MGTDNLSYIFLYNPTQNPYTTTNSFADVLPYWNKYGAKTVTIYVTNTGGANSATFQILGSVDDGANFEAVVVASAPIATGVTVVSHITDYYTQLKVQIKATVASS